MSSKKIMTKNRAFASIIGCCFAALPGTLSAEEVTLKSSDGLINMSGELLAFEDGVYTLRTQLGDINLTASQVICEGTACPAAAGGGSQINISGSDAVGLGLMPLLLEGYAGSVNASASISGFGDGVTIVADLVADGGFGDQIGSFRVESLGSDSAFTALVGGGPRIGMSSRRILPKEARELRDVGAGNMVSPSQEHVIAVDSLIIVTHPDNPVETLTLDQVADIFAGRISNWAEVGGRNIDILPVNLDLGSGTRAVFEDRVMDGKEINVPDNVNAVDQVDDVADMVNANEGAIGYTGFAFQRGAKPISIINECGIEMIPDAFSARTEEYALQRRLYLYTREDSDNPQIDSLVNYASSAAADGVISKSGFISLGIDRQSQPMESSRAQMLLSANADAYETQLMRKMLSDMTAFDRLSTTFRFRTASSRLDERGRIDMVRLVDYLQNQPQDTEVLLVGFTDSVGAFDSNRALSENRARAALVELESYGKGRLDNLKLSSVGYGEIAPSGCNIAESGRRINRRVEVWIKSPT